MMHSQAGGGRQDTLDYIQSMLAQLRTMAQDERCDMLAYLIEMAYLEASDVIRVVGASGVAENKRNASP